MNAISTMSTAERIVHTTIRLEMTNLQGDATGSGTGFFFDFGKPGQPMKPAIITNKHVVEGFDRAVGTLTVVKNDKTVSETLELKG